MRNINIKPFLFILLGFSGLIWFAISMVNQLDLKNIIDFVRPIPKVVTADFILIWIFTKWIWRWKWLQGWLVPFPDLNGTWTGQIHTSWKDSDGKTPDPILTMLTIKQTFGRISCVMYTSEMISHSYTEGFYIDKEKQLRYLCYSYTSKPKAILRERSTPHDGTILFKIIRKPVYKLEGEYWTQRKTIGTVTLVFKTKELLEELPSDFKTQILSDKSKYSYGSE